MKYDCEAWREWQGQGKTKALAGKTLSQYKHVHTNSTRIGPWLNTGLQSDRLVTTYLSHEIPRNNLVRQKWPYITEEHAALTFSIVHTVITIIIIMLITSILQTASKHFCRKCILEEQRLALLIINISTQSRCVVNFTPTPPNPCKIPMYPLNMRLSEPQSGCFGEQ